MNKASSALLATAGVTVGLLGFALPAGAATSPTGGGSAPSVSQPNFPSGSGTSDQGDKGKGGGDKGNGGSDQGKGGRGDKGGRGRTGDPNPYPTKTKSPCPTRTHKPCPPKPCEAVVVKPCKTHKDKDGHLTSYRQAPKHVLVCKPKPCPTKAKPCPPKCKKHQPHKHPHPQKHAGIN
jgi:hypothetical protein